MDDDFLLDEDETFDEGYVESNEDSEDESFEEESEENEEELSEKSKEDYHGKMTADEIWLSSAYNDIVNASSKDVGKISVGGGRAFDAVLVDAVRSVIMANPLNTSSFTVENITKEFFQAQGHSRIVSTLYTPDKPLRVSDLDDDLGGDDDFEFNQQYAKALREQISRFVKYLADRDLEKDSAVSKRRKQRQLPAFIIFLFSSGMYDLIISCPTMPKEYDEQIVKAMERISKAKDDVVEALADRYEEHNRQEVADMVRKLGTAWFKREPAEIRTVAEYAPLNLTQQDVIDYREFRSKFMNVSRSLTQETISDMIEVVLDKNAGIYERLKDKTRAEAIADAKKTYKEWSKENPIDSEMADAVIWKKES